jgi:iron complex outermembrane recepter protein
MSPLLFALAIVLFAATGARAQAQTSNASQLAELKKLSIEELAETDITGSGRVTERLDQVASAVTVITSDDLRRYGVTTLPEALRLADTVHVAQVAGAGYAISVRGFNITTANKLLVMIDGRTVYSPVYSGVFWEAQDLVIADIDRIEVVRGPGGTLWGANAVNGVIHVITKLAADTRGTFVNVASGTDGLGPFAVRHGGRFGATGSYRVYGKVRFDEAAELLQGGSAGNDHDFGQAGFRIESGRSGNSFLVVQGDVFEGRSGLSVNSDRSIRWRGANLMTRWTHRTSGGAETTAQAYYDNFYRRVPVQYRGALQTFDFDVQHQRRLPRTTMVLGAGYRQYRGDDLGDGPGFYFEPRERVSHRSNLFGQAEVRVATNLFITGGIKFERNEFTGVEAQPSAAARWSAGTQTLWVSAGRAVRVPTRFDTDLRFRIPNSDLVALTGTEDFRSESVMAYEAGYRRRFGNRVSVDVAAFENRYDNLRSQEVPVPPIPIRLMNMMNAVTRGVEVTSKAQLAPWWQVGGGYTHLWKRISFDPASTDRTAGASEGNDPRHIVNVRSHIDIGSRLELDAFYRYVGALPAPAVEGYSEVDARLGYRVRTGWEISVIGTNLLAASHLEFRAGTPPQVYQRGVTLRSTWRF